MVAAILDFFIAHNFVAIARTCTKFHMQAKFDILHVVMP